MTKWLLAVLLAGCSSGGSTGALDASVDLSASADAAIATDAAVAHDDDASDGSVVASFGPYDVDGPDSVTDYDDTAAGLSVHVYVPSSTGVHPVVVLAAGLQQPASAYASYGHRLATHGFVAIVTSDPGAFTSTSTVVADLEALVLTWLPGDAKLAGKVDVTHVGLAGHSRGGQASLLAAEDTLKTHVLAWVGLDPVDSAPMAGAPQARTTIATIGIPLVFLGGGTSTSCSPAADNYDVLFAAAQPPAVALTLTNASHTEFEDPATCAFCGFCTPAGTADAPTVLAESVRYLTASFAYRLAGDASVGATLDGAGAALDVAAGRVTREAK